MAEGMARDILQEKKALLVNSFDKLNNLYAQSTNASLTKLKNITQESSHILYNIIVTLSKNYLRQKCDTLLTYR